MGSRNQPTNINIAQRSRKIDTEQKLLDYIKMKLGHPMITVDLTDDMILLNIDDTIRKFSDFAYGGEQTLAFIIESDPGIQDYVLDPRVQAIESVSFGNSLGSNNQSTAGGISLGSFGSIGINYVPYIDNMGNVSSLMGSGDGSCASSAGGEAGGLSQGSNLDKMSNAFAIMSQKDTMQALFARGVNFEFNSNTKILRIFEEVSAPFMIEASVEYEPNPDYDNIYSHPWIKDFSVALCRSQWSTVTGKYSASLVGGSEINFDKMQTEAEAEIERLNEDLINKYTEAMGIFSG